MKLTRNAVEWLITISITIAVIVVLYGSAALFGIGGETVAQSYEPMTVIRTKNPIEGGGTTIRFYNPEHRVTCFAWDRPRTMTPIGLGCVVGRR